MVVDTRELANGPHSVRVTVTDVAGQRHAVRSLHRRRQERRAAQRREREPDGEARGVVQVQPRAPDLGDRRVSAAADDRGRLTAPDGQPIAAAVLDLTRQGAAAREQPRRAIGTVVTDRKGRFTVQAPRGSSREIRIGYRAYTLDDAPAATATLNLNVKAALSLAVSPDAGAQRQRRHVHAAGSAAVPGSSGRR